MAIKPSDVPKLSDEDETNFKNVIKQIDSKITKSRMQEHSKNSFVGTTVKPRELAGYEDWMFNPLINEYLNAGWEKTKGFYVYGGDPFLEIYTRKILN